jgi:NADH-quinone oxidoreductase subunit L
MSAFALIPVFPAASALVLFLAGRKLPRLWIGLQACGAVLASFLLGGLAFLQSQQAGFPAAGRVESLFGWIRAGAFDVSVSFRLDSLSLLMILVVSGVGFLIHVYSTGYLAGDSSYARYFGLLNLFVFAMLILVMASNLVLMFVGWEGVGLCSYLLIGFWFERDAAARAGQKAFLFNRIGDAAFIVGLLFLLVAVGSGDFAAVEKAVAAGRLAPGLVTLIGLLLFAGATGKSAQIPLYLWLPDAMEGPTPVSALIHAATMVTAGVYLVARLHVLYSFSATASLVVAVVGGLTAVYAATMALVENDIKKILAYSTISQIGYMFIGCGVGAYAAGLFHLTTHAFFKSLLFLGAGSVMHALNGETDLRRMGGLRRALPRTHLVFLAGTLAISGVPFFSGFFSKDAILNSAFAAGRYGIWALGLFTACLTSFYMFRLYFLAFGGETRLAGAVPERIHESPAAMTVPMAALAFFAVAAGYLGLPAVLGAGGNPIGRFLGSVLPSPGGEPAASGTEWLLISGSVLAAATGIAAAFVFYVRDRTLPGALARKWPGPYRLLAGHYFVDEAVEAAVVRPVVDGGRALYENLDLKVIDGAANGAAAAAGRLGRAASLLQSGFLRDTGLLILAGAVAALAVFIF